MSRTSSPSPSPSTTAVLARLREDRPLVAVELRPPRSGMDYADSVDAWIDMNHSVRQLGRRDTIVFLTDNAVGQAEEENLNHLMDNLAGDVELSKIVPFLTCKHSLEYSRLYAARAASHGFEALTILGGDQSVGAPRCVPHAYELRARIREWVPALTLGGWANPHRDAAEQIAFIEDHEFGAEFFLTQIVSHHSVREVERFVTEMRRRGITTPGVFGVFYYRSANPRTLERLGQFFPVPARELSREFAEGSTPDEICARTIRALREVGVEKIYLSNLGIRRLDAQYRRILDWAGA